MRAVKRMIAAVLGLVCLYLLFAGQLNMRRELAIETGRMKNIEVVLPETKPPAATSAVSQPDPTPEPEQTEQPEELDETSYDPSPAANGSVRETTITGGLTIKNETNFEVDVQAILEEGTSVRLAAEGPQILIIHTHSSEAYTPAGLDRYEASDTNRTEDTAYNIVRVGDELTDILQAAGLNVIHDRGIYDYPSYTGSYGRSGAAVEEYLAEYPSISVVIDMHRDALGAGDTVYKIMAEESGVVASQIMLLVGSNESGLEHPNWRTNLSLALYLQQAADTAHPTLMRPVELVPQRYNQHLTGGSLILEVGSSGNTLQEALAAIRLFGNDIAPALLALTEQTDADAE